MNQPGIIFFLLLIIKGINSIEELVSNEKKGSTRLSKQNFPIVLPPYYDENGEIQLMYKPDTWGSCLFYSEGFNIVVYSKKSKIGPYASAVIRSEDAVWDFNEGDVKCIDSPVGDYTFTVRINTTQDVFGFNLNKLTPVFSIEPQIISFSIKIRGDKLGYWKLIGAIAKELRITSKSSSFLDKDIELGVNTHKKTIDYAGMNSIHGWAWGCQTSQALFFPVDKDLNGNYLIGISFYNTEIQPFNAVKNVTDRHGHQAHIVGFSSNMEDCTGTFSIGIIISIVLLSTLIFGFLMLNSIKTHDRFDHPKQKQIVINLRE